MSRFPTPSEVRARHKQVFDGVDAMLLQLQKEFKDENSDRVAWLLHAVDAKAIAQQDLMRLLKLAQVKVKFDTRQKHKKWALYTAAGGTVAVAAGAVCKGLVVAGVGAAAGACYPLVAAGVVVTVIGGVVYWIYKRGDKAASQATLEGMQLALGEEESETKLEKGVGGRLRAYLEGLRGARAHVMRVTSEHGTAEFTVGTSRPAKANRLPLDEVLAAAATMKRVKKHMEALKLVPACRQWLASAAVLEHAHRTAAQTRPQPASATASPATGHGPVQPPLAREFGT